MLVLLLKEPDLALAWTSDFLISVFFSWSVKKKHSDTCHLGFIPIDVAAWCHILLLHKVPVNVFSRLFSPCTAGDFIQHHLHFRWKYYINFCDRMQQGFVVKWIGSDPAGNERGSIMKPSPLFGSVQNFPAVLRKILVGQSNFCWIGWKDEEALSTLFSRLLYREALLNISAEQSLRAENTLNSHSRVLVMAF